jgi:membrane protease YdiL (CAAX protease family)
LSLNYSQLHRLGRWGWEWSLPGVLAALLGVLLVQPILLVLVVAAVNAVAGSDTVSLDRLTDKAGIRPADLAALNLNNASWILLAIALTWFLHRVRPGWLLSVARRIRWRWLAVCCGLAVLTLAATLLVEIAVPQTANGHVSEHYSSSTILGFVAAVVLTTPLQSIGEEFLFRGYLTQAVGAFAPRVFAVVVPALLFAAFHGSQGLPVFIDRLLFGLLAGVLVIVTGGLEAGIAMHVLNNLVAFGLAVATETVSSSLAASGGTWWLIPVTLTQNGLFLVLVVLARRRQSPDFASAPVAG